MFCKKCGKKIPDDARICPYCETQVNDVSGAREASKKKKHGCMIGCLGFIVLVLLFGVIVNLTGNNVGSKNATKETTTTQQQQKRAYKIGETFKSNAFEVTIMGKDVAKRINDKSGYLYSEATGTFMIVHVHYKNIADNAKSLDSSAFKLTADGKEYSPTILTIRMDENIFHSTINPGIEKDGNIYFDVPESVTKSNLTLKLSSSFVSDNFNGEVELY